MKNGKTKRTKEEKMVTVGEENKRVMIFDGARERTKGRTSGNFEGGYHSWVPGRME
jgi:hypothetical protein